ncbi:ppic-type ppiase domain protein [Treponema primitia ZAS-2]|uniref:Ppic-type ppiase domain protein n=1 Tax=Treponema primitia (strain ATCC BAA-887 / DSM 12427 / ZAS-2) TaxID=545694 RepID=F5YJM3_TREPZ|nr:SurA N-terminal domain-containing protein [Treponema primitia]AEF83746.1 ppic-type ppiase domain protein [Treponema primitia ZAS-2]
MAPREKKQLVHEENSTKGEWVRRFKANPFIFIGTIVILIIVIVAFVLVPAIVPSAGGPQVDLVFGSYDKIPISYVPGNFLAQVQDTLARYMQSSITESNYQFATYQIWRQAFEETVIHTAVLQEMKRAGFLAPETLVDKQVAQLPQFQENGRFSVSRFRDIDRISRMSLWREVQDSIAEGHYREDIAGLRVSSQESEFFSNMAARLRRFDMALFPLSGYPAEELTAFATAEADLFRTLHLSRITITSSEREAQQVLAAVKNGSQTFEEAAQTQSQDGFADRGGDMGIRMAYELAADVPDEAERAAVIATPPGEYSPIVKVPAGWAFFRTEDAPYPLNPEEPGSLDKVRAYMTETRRGVIEDWLFAKAREFSGTVQELGFDAAIAAQGVERRGFGPVPLNYGGVSMDTGGENLFATLASQQVSELSGAEENTPFWQAAFFTPLLTPSEPLVVGDTVIVLYPLEETVKDGDELENIKTFYGPWVSQDSEQGLRTHFLQSKRLDDNFFPVFSQYFWQ